jgi:tetratricopeptide (TPR) repeat protein
MPEPPSSAGAVDIAMAALGGNGPDSPAWRLLEEQQRLVREQVALARNERFRNRIKAARDLSIAAGVGLLVLGALALVWDASRARGMVVEPFSVAPQLQTQGITGQAAAARLLDHVGALEPPPEDLALAGLGVRSSETAAARIEIPQAGVSLDEVSRWLRRTLGRETPVTGELRPVGGGVALTVRVAGQPGDVVLAPDGDLDAALKLGAARLYARTEPLRWSRHLFDRGLDRASEAAALWSRRGSPPSPEERAQVIGVVLRDLDEAVRIARGVAEGGGPDRAWGYAFWGSYLWGRDNDGVESVRLLERARRLDPELAYAPATLTTIHNILGEPQLEREAALSADRLFRRRRADVEAAHVYWARLQMSGNLARTEGAYGDAARRFCRAADEAYKLRTTGRNCALYLARNYDGKGAERAMNSVPIEGRGRVYPLQIAAWNAASRGDPVAEVEAYRRWEQAAVFEQRQARVPTAVWPGVAVALAKAGRKAEAEALTAKLPGCYECLRARGQVAAIGRNWSEAERWLDAAARRGPEIPFAYFNLAEARAARGDVEGALRALRDARRYGPRWAAPLKLEGDLLARDARYGAAARSYEQAANRAPRWGALHLASGGSLEAAGRRGEARERYAAALALDLSAAERAEAQRRLNQLGPGT